MVKACKMVFTPRPRTPGYDEESKAMTDASMSREKKEDEGISGDSSYFALSGRNPSEETVVGRQNGAASEEVEYQLRRKRGAAALKFPNTRVALWDSSPTGEEVEIFAGSVSVPSPILTSDAVDTLHGLLERKLRSGSLFASCGPAGGVKSLTIRDKEPGGEESVIDVDVAVGPLAFSDQSSIEERMNSKVRSAFSSTSHKLHWADVVPLWIHVRPSEHGIMVAINALVPCATVRATPLNPLGVCDVALARSLAMPRQSSRGAATGYLSMDQSRKLLPLTETEARAFNVPIVGIWVTGVCSLRDPLILAASMRYVLHRKLRERAGPEGKFLLLKYCEARGGGGSGVQLFELQCDVSMEEQEEPSGCRIRMIRHSCDVDLPPDKIYRDVVFQMRAVHRFKTGNNKPEDAARKDREVLPAAALEMPSPRLQAPKPFSGKLEAATNLSCQKSIDFAPSFQDARRNRSEPTQEHEETSQNQKSSPSSTKTKSMLLTSEAAAWPWAELLQPGGTDAGAVSTAAATLLAVTLNQQQASQHAMLQQVQQLAALKEQVEGLQRLLLDKVDEKKNAAQPLPRGAATHCDDDVDGTMMRVEAATNTSLVMEATTPEGGGRGRGPGGIVAMEEENFSEEDTAEMDVMSVGTGEYQAQGDKHPDYLEVERRRAATASSSVFEHSIAGGAFVGQLTASSSPPSFFSQRPVAGKKGNHCGPLKSVVAEPCQPGRVGPPSRRDSAAMQLLERDARKSFSSDSIPAEVAATTTTTQSIPFTPCVNETDSGPPEEVEDDEETHLPDADLLLSSSMDASVVEYIHDDEEEEDYDMYGAYTGIITLMETMEVAPLCYAGDATARVKLDSRLAAEGRGDSIASHADIPRIAYDFEGYGSGDESDDEDVTLYRKYLGGHTAQDELLASVDAADNGEVREAIRLCRQRHSLHE